MLPKHPQSSRKSSSVADERAKPTPLGESVGGLDMGEMLELRRVIQNFPRLIGRIAVELGQAEPLLMGVLDGGTGLTGLLDVAEMHGELGDAPDVAAESGRSVVIVEVTPGWEARVA